jgi:MFS family permease
LNDVGSEMVFPLLPLFLTETLRAGPGFVGLVEGAAETVSNFLKLVSGYWADRVKRRTPLVAGGYAVAALGRPLLGLATAPWHALLIRVTDRVGKGVRTSPRDVLIAEAAGPGQAGRAFGFHRAMDHAGAVIGPLVAAALLAGGMETRSVLLLTAIPGLLAVAVVFTVRERRTEAPRVAPRASETPVPGVKPRAMPRAFLAYLGILLLFSFGNSTDAFLLLRARDLGLSAAAIPILWAVLHVSKMVTAYYGGGLADRVSPTRVIVMGWGVYMLVYLGLGAASEPWHAWALFTVYGLYYGLTEPAEKVLVRALAPPESRGRAFGLYHFTVGASALPASLLTAWLWRTAGAPAALAVCAALAAVASVLLLAWSFRARRTGLVS